MEEDKKRSVRRKTLTDDEARLFRDNYKFMWEELATTPYLVLYGKEQAYTAKNIPIQGADILPSYAVCFSCMRDGYTPSLRIVYKIVKFFNANFSPSISAWQFLNEDLSKNANVRYKGTAKYDSRFIGTYNCYYISSNTDARPAGALLKIYLRDNVLKASLVTGIYSDEGFQDNALRELFRKDTLTKKDFDRFHASRAPGSKRYYYFEGNAEVTANSVLIVFYDFEEDDARKLVLTLNTKRFPSSRKEPYHGGLAFIMTTSDDPFDTRFYQMGLINSMHGSYSLQDDRIAKLLKLRTSGKDIRLTVKADDAWYKLALDLMDQHQKG